jgi:ectoine hydroxylase-related dioxygenase (phytanoyl-CoA dioxygenase family)
MTAAAFWKVSESDIAAYERDGVVCLRRVLDEAWLEPVRAGVDEVLKHPGPQGAVDDSAGGRYAYDTWMWTRNEAFWRLAIESPLPSITAQIMRSKTSFLMADIVFTKEPNTPKPVPWHQDMPYGFYDGSQVCSAWLALDPVTLESGALEYARASHKAGEWYAPVEFIKGDGYVGSELKPMPDIDAHRDRFDIIHFDMEPGDLLLHNLLMLHGSPGNGRSDRRRRAVAYRFAGDDSTYAVRNVGAKPIWDPGIRAGDKFGCDLFPQVWPPASRPRRFWEDGAQAGAPAAASNAAL